MKCMTNGDNGESCRADALTAFLADYASALLGCGATCIRIEKNVRRMARHFGTDAEITVMPSHVEVSEWKGDGDCGHVAVRRIRHGGIDFRLNAALSRLSWDVADGKCDFGKAVETFHSLLEAPRTGRTEVLLLASLANASFCRLFGGDAMAMAIVFVSTLVGMRLKQMMLGAQCDARVTVVCAAFVSATLSACGHVFGLGTTPEIALGTSVLYLVPGVPYINVVSDVIDRHYLCAFSHMMDALVITVCLSAGLCAGMLILGLVRF